MGKDSERFRGETVKPMDQVASDCLSSVKTWNYSVCPVDDMKPR